MRPPYYAQNGQQQNVLRGRMQALPWRRHSIQNRQFTARTMYQRRPFWPQNRQHPHVQQCRRFGIRGRQQEPQQYPEYGRSGSDWTDRQRRRRASMYGQRTGMSDLADAFSRMSVKQQRRRSGFAGAPMMSMNNMNNRRRRRSGFYGGSLNRMLPAATLRGPFYIVAPGNALIGAAECEQPRYMHPSQGYDVRRAGAESRGAGPPRQNRIPYNSTLQNGSSSSMQSNSQIQARPQPSAVPRLAIPQPSRPSMQNRPNTMPSSVSAPRPSLPPAPITAVRMQRSKSMGDMRAKPPPADMPPLPPLPRHLSVPSNKNYTKPSSAGSNASQASTTTFAVNPPPPLPTRSMPAPPRPPPASDTLRRPSESTIKARPPMNPSKQTRPALNKAAVDASPPAPPMPQPTFELNKKIHYKPSGGSKDDSDTSSIYTAYWHESRPRVGAALFNNKTEGIGIPKLGGSTVYVNKKQILKHPDEEKKPSAEGRGASAGSFREEQSRDPTFLRPPDFRQMNGQTRLGSSY